MKLFWSLLTSEYWITILNEQICKNLYKMMPRMYTNGIADCVPASSVLELAHTISAIHGRGMFFSGVPTSCSRLTSSYQFWWRAYLTCLPGGHFHPKGSETRIPNAELVPQKRLYYIMFCLGWHIKQQHRGQKVLLKNWGCLFLKRHCLNTFV